MTEHQEKSADQWRELTTQLAEAGEAIRSFAFVGDEPADEAEFNKVLAMTFAQAYWMNFHSDVSAPEWLPFIGQLIPSGAINPDTLYYSARLDPNGTYRVSGERGTVYMLDFQLSQRQPGYPGQSGARTASIDGDSLTLDSQGRFDFVISKERPEGVADWYPLPPESGSILMRQVSYDWEGERDARVAIERLDTPIGRPRPTAAETQALLARLPEHMMLYQKQFLNYKAQVRALGPANQLHRRIRTETGGEGQGGGMGGQVIYHGNFDLADDEALLIETTIPERCGYFNIQVTDEMHLAIDPLFHQASLNGHQARLDSDGKFRAVISVQDPAVPNWLDTAGYRHGGIIGRWTRSSGAPVPDARVIKLKNLRDHLPADTPTVSADERERIVRARSCAMQRRRR
ncbi:hypothetical protein [Sphingobium sp.]|uniref:hypothetical protein n=1 Tax=Sphingobium sp. TaxID=1912891 RepID=UPI0028BEE1C7|nr:hypothetical protein [Sphingobium sp.]